jgi:hypothetical protein
MIVRIFSDGQYRLPDEARERLDELDTASHRAIDADDEQAYRAAFDALIAYVRSTGERLGDDELEGSDFMVPPADTSLEEARAEFTGEGLIPE